LSPNFQEFDETWTKKIRAAKFCWFNAYWLNMMKGDGDAPNAKPPKYEPPAGNDGVNVYGYARQAILMPEDGKYI